MQTTARELSIWGPGGWYDPCDWGCRYQEYA